MDTHMSDDLSDASSIASSSLMSDTASLSSSILNYQYENGRRYKAGNYVLPNDDQEQDRLDIMHHVHCMILGGKLFAAPAKDPRTILDIGTGTGLWAIQVADEFPDAKVVATDLSAIQPGWIPPNLNFEIDDIEAEWSFNEKFDYIHLRSMGGSIADWPALLQKCLAGLNPGGYIEVCDGETWCSTDDGSLPESSDVYQWQKNLNLAGVKFGRDLNVIPKMTELLKEAGFENIEDKVVKVPLNQWDTQQSKQQRQWGMYMTVVMLEVAESYSLQLFTRVLGWEREALDKLIIGVRADLQNPKYHMYTNFHHAIGQKPMA